MKLWDFCRLNCTPTRITELLSCSKSLVIWTKPF